MHPVDWSWRINNQQGNTSHALWIGLCTKIREGSIDRDMAVKIFESERARNVLERAKEEAERGELKGI